MLESGTYPVDSSAIELAEWDHTAQVLWIKWIGNNKMYEFKCSDQVVEDFLNAPSKGKFVNNVLRKYYRAF